MLISSYPLQSESNSHGESGLDSMNAIVYKSTTSEKVFMGIKHESPPASCKGPAESVPAKQLLVSGWKCCQPAAARLPVTCSGSHILLVLAGTASFSQCGLIKWRVDEISSMFTERKWLSDFMLLCRKGRKEGGSEVGKCPPASAESALLCPSNSSVSRPAPLNKSIQAGSYWSACPFAQPVRVYLSQCSLIPLECRPVVPNHVSFMTFLPLFQTRWTPLPSHSLDMYTLTPKSGNWKNMMQVFWKAGHVILTLLFHLLHFSCIQLSIGGSAQWPLN